MLQVAASRPVEQGVGAAVTRCGNVCETSCPVCVEMCGAMFIFEFFFGKKNKNILITHILVIFSNYKI